MIDTIQKNSNKTITMDLSKYVLMEENYDDQRFGPLTIYYNPDDEKDIICVKTKQFTSDKEFYQKLRMAEERLYFNCPYILKMLFVHPDHDQLILNIGFEYPNEDLSARASMLKNPTEVLKLMHDILSAMSFLAIHKMIHGNIRPEYIYYNHKESNYILLDRLGDYLNPYQIQQENIFNGLSIYLDPFVFSNLCQNNLTFSHNPFKAESFSFGMVIISMILYEENNDEFLSIQNLYNKESGVFDEQSFLALLKSMKQTFFSHEDDELIFDFITDCILNLDVDQRFGAYKAFKMLEDTLWRIATSSSNNLPESNQDNQNILQPVYNDFSAIVESKTLHSQYEFNKSETSEPRQSDNLPNVNFFDSSTLNENLNNRESENVNFFEPQIVISDEGQYQQFFNEHFDQANHPLVMQELQNPQSTNELIEQYENFSVDPKDLISGRNSESQRVINKPTISDPIRIEDQNLYSNPIQTDNNFFDIQELNSNELQRNSFFGKFAERVSKKEIDNEFFESPQHMKTNEILEKDATVMNNQFIFNGSAILPPNQQTNSFINQQGNSNETFNAFQHQYQQSDFNSDYQFDNLNDFPDNLQRQNTVESVALGISLVPFPQNQIHMTQTITLTGSNLQDIGFKKESCIGEKDSTIISHHNHNNWAQNNVFGNPFENQSAAVFIKNKDMVENNSNTESKSITEDTPIPSIKNINMSNENMPDYDMLLKKPTINFETTANVLSDKNINMNFQKQEKVNQVYLEEEHEDDRAESNCDNRISNNHDLEAFNKHPSGENSDWGFHQDDVNIDSNDISTLKKLSHISNSIPMLEKNDESNMKGSILHKENEELINVTENLSQKITQENQIHDSLQFEVDASLNKQPNDAILETHSNEDNSPDGLNKSVNQEQSTNQAYQGEEHQEANQQGELQLSIRRSIPSLQNDKPEEDNLAIINQNEESHAMTVEDNAVIQNMTENAELNQNSTIPIFESHSTDIPKVQEQTLEFSSQTETNYKLDHNNNSMTDNKHDLQGIADERQGKEILENPEISLSQVPENFTTDNKILISSAKEESFKFTVDEHRSSIKTDNEKSITLQRVSKNNLNGTDGCIIYDSVNFSALKENEGEVEEGNMDKSLDGEDQSKDITGSQQTVFEPLQQYLHASNVEVLHNNVNKDTSVSNQESYIRIEEFDMNKQTTVFEDRENPNEEISQPNSQMNNEMQNEAEVSAINQMDTEYNKQEELPELIKIASVSQKSKILDDSTPKLSILMPELNELHAIRSDFQNESFITLKSNTQRHSDNQLSEMQIEIIKHTQLKIEPQTAVKVQNAIVPNDQFLNPETEELKESKRPSLYKQGSSKLIPKEDGKNVGSVDLPIGNFNKPTTTEQNPIALQTFIQKKDHIIYAPPKIQNNINVIPHSIKFASYHQINNYAPPHNQNFSKAISNTQYIQLPIKNQIPIMYSPNVRIVNVTPEAMPLAKNSIELPQRSSTIMISPESKTMPDKSSQHAVQTNFANLPKTKDGKIIINVADFKEQGNIEAQTYNSNNSQINLKHSLPGNNQRSIIFTNKNLPSAQIPPFMNQSQLKSQQVPITQVQNLAHQHPYPNNQYLLTKGNYNSNNGLQQYGSSTSKFPNHLNYPSYKPDPNISSVVSNGNAIVNQGQNRSKVSPNKKELELKYSLQDDRSDKEFFAYNKSPPHHLIQYASINNSNEIKLSIQSTQRLNNSDQHSNNPNHKSAPSTNNSLQSIQVNLPPNIGDKINSSHLIQAFPIVKQQPQQTIPSNVVYDFSKKINTQNVSNLPGFNANKQGLPAQFINGQPLNFAKQPVHVLESPMQYNNFLQQNNYTKKFAPNTVHNNLQRKSVDIQFNQNLPNFEKSNTPGQTMKNEARQTDIKFAEANVGKKIGN